MLEIFQARFQQYMNCEFSGVQMDLEKAEELEIKLPTSTGSKKKQELQKSICFCFIDHAKAFDCVNHNKLWKFFKEMWIPDHLTCQLRDLYAGQEATHETTDWFQIGKGVSQSSIVSPCLFNLYAEYIMRNAGLAEAQAGIKITRRNITSDMQMTPPSWKKVKQN